MDEQKVKVVREWSQAPTVKELQRFLGFAYFYRWFIRNYNGIATALTSVLKVPRNSHGPQTIPLKLHTDYNASVKLAHIDLQMFIKGISGKSCIRSSASFSPNELPYIILKVIFLKRIIYHACQ